MLQPAQPDPHRACAYINAQAIAHNLQTLRQRISAAAPGHKPPIWAVVKANAYGHGLEHVLPGLQDADGLAVLSLPEAYRCRALGWTGPVLVMDDTFTSSELNDPTLYPLHLAINHSGQIEQLENLSGSGKPHAWLRFAGQLHHAGLLAANYRPAYTRLQALLAAGRLSAIGHFQHYANAEDPELQADERQQFTQLTASLPGLVCTENSASLLTSPVAAAHTSWLRSGLALYGASPLAGITGIELGLQPAMLLQAPIYSIQHLQAGDRVGYSSTFIADRPVRIGLVHCGYADGYPRSAPTGCPVWVPGGPASIVGRVSMDSLAIDISNYPDIGPGHQATLWGSHQLPIESIAQSAGTIAAQLLTGLTAQVPRLAVLAA
ncbi:alanine racemase [Alcaligenaceae bacterium]|nr:alanine racemase [Alcaligenaceae bacterium]